MCEGLPSAATVQIKSEGHTRGHSEILRHCEHIGETLRNYKPSVPLADLGTLGMLNSVTTSANYPQCLKWFLMGSLEGERIIVT